MDEEAIVTTRRSWHTVAEHVAAAVLHHHTAKIGLRATPAGFGTPRFALDDAPTVVRVELDQIVLDVNGDTRRAPLTTIADAATFVGIDPGGPADVYRLVTPLELDVPLTIDTAAARHLADWFELSNEALSTFAAAHPEDEPTLIQLWPEHFDLALTAAEVNYGGSPGDREHDRPYLYVGPWNPPSGGGFWNEPFGASVPDEEIDGVEAALAYLEQGREFARSR